MTQKRQLKTWIPRSFQKEAIKIGIGQAACGFLLPPGGGKTSIIYALFSILQKKNFVKKMLVICPIRPMYRVWPNQCHTFNEFDHLRVNVLHGKDKDAALVDDDADIYVINPEGLDWLFAARDGKADKVRLRWLAEKFQVLVVDESTKFANSGTKRFKLLKDFVPEFKRRYILTGTIRPKNLENLFGQVYILDEGQSLGRYITHYRLEYFYPDVFNKYTWHPQPDAEQRIGRKIAQLVYRQDLKDLNLDLPELVTDDIWVELPPTARSIYDQMELNMLALLESGGVVAENAAVATGKCRQIANGMLINTETAEVSHIHDEKLNALIDLIEQLQGEPCLVTYEFKADAARIMEALKCPNISSGNARKDDANIQLFSEGKLPVVIGSPQSIALGIDGLQESCCHIAMFGCTWNLQDYLQVIDRVRRQGSKSQRVWLHRILALDTLDERMLTVLDKREKEQADFMTLLKQLRKVTK